jgi:hypothetical protein
MFDPSVGRWLQVDPSFFEGGDSNLYRYTGNDPTNAEDPSGLAEINRNGLPGISQGNRKDLTKTRKIKKTIPFGDGTASINVATEDYKVEGAKSADTYIEVGVTLDQKTLAQERLLKRTHWVQFMRGQVYDNQGQPSNTVFMGDIYRARPAGAFMARTVGTTLAGPAVVGNILAPPPFQDVIPDLSNAVVGTIQSATSEQITVLRRPGIDYLDTGSLDSPYYDETGSHLRTGTSLAIFDAPRGGVSKMEPKRILSATDYLVVDGKPVYEVAWAVTIEWQGDKKEPEFTYSLSSGIALDFPGGKQKPATVGTLQIPGQRDRVITMPNPLGQ